MAQVIDFLTAFKTDTKAEVEGTETTLRDCGDVKFKVARLNNPTYRRTLAALYKKHRAVLESKGDEAEAKSNEILAEVYAKAVLVGWAGTITMGGVATAYSEAAAKALCLNPDFRERVEEAAADFKTFLVTKDEEDLGN